MKLEWTVISEFHEYANVAADGTHVALLEVEKYQDGWTPSFTIPFGWKRFGFAVESIDDAKAAAVSALGAFAVRLAEATKELEP